MNLLSKIKRDLHICRRAVSNHVYLSREERRASVYERQREQVLRDALDAKVRVGVVRAEEEMKDESMNELPKTEELDLIIVEEVRKNAEHFDRADARKVIELVWEFEARNRPLLTNEVVAREYGKVLAAGLEMPELRPQGQDLFAVGMKVGADFASPRIAELESELKRDRTEPQPVDGKCPSCGSRWPERHPAVQCDGEVQLCEDKFHSSTWLGREALEKAKPQEVAQTIAPRKMPTREELAAKFLSMQETNQVADPIALVEWAFEQAGVATHGAFVPPRPVEEGDRFGLLVTEKGWGVVIFLGGSIKEASSWGVAYNPNELSRLDIDPSRIFKVTSQPPAALKSPQIELRFEAGTPVAIEAALRQLAEIVANNTHPRFGKKNSVALIAGVAYRLALEEFPDAPRDSVF